MTTRMTSTKAEHGRSGGITLALARDSANRGLIDVMWGVDNND